MTRFRVGQSSNGLVRVILLYKSDLGISVSPLGAKLAFFTLNSNLGYRPQSKSARLGVSKCIGDLIEYGLVYKSAFSFFLTLLF